VILTIDIAHPPLPPDAVEQTLLDSWGRVRNSPTLRILKIVHGYGSSGRGGKTKEIVRNWIFRNSSRFRAVIDGTSYTLFDGKVRDMIGETGPITDPDLGAQNQGVTIVWVK